MFVFFELTTELVSAHWWDITLISQSHSFVAITERSGPTCASGGNIIETITSASSIAYNILPCILNLSVLGNENFCLDVEVLRLWLEVSRSVIFLIRLIISNKIHNTDSSNITKSLSWVLLNCCKIKIKSLDSGYLKRRLRLFRHGFILLFRKKHTLYRARFFWSKKFRSQANLELLLQLWPFSIKNSPLFLREIYFFCSTPLILLLEIYFYFCTSNSFLAASSLAKAFISCFLSIELLD